MLTLGCRIQHGSMRYSLEIKNFFDIENIALFIPCGILMSSVRYKNIMFPVVNSVLISLLIELFQLIARLGFFELMDIIYNVMGSLIGIILLLGCIDKQRFRQEIFTN